jgi:hypothetical protein
MRFPLPASRLVAAAQRHLAIARGYADGRISRADLDADDPILLAVEQADELLKAAAHAFRTAEAEFDEARESLFGPPGCRG